MAENNNAGSSHSGQAFDKNYYETYAKKTDKLLKEMKICMDQVLGLRGDISELEVNLLSLYNPKLLKDLEDIKEMIASFQSELDQEETERRKDQLQETESLKFTCQD